VADPVLVATPKGATANAYVTRAAVQLYLDTRLTIDAWTAAANVDKDRALIMATSRLEQERYAGSPTTTTQRLQWPRQWVYDPAGNAYDDDLIPRPVEEATAELALALLAGEVTLAPTGLEGFEELTVGPVSLTPRGAGGSPSLPAQVTRLLRGLRTTAAGTVPVVRG
jgi:hypothetical protein